MKDMLSIVVNVTLFINYFNFMITRKLLKEEVMAMNDMSSLSFRKRWLDLIWLFVIPRGR